MQTLLCWLLGAALLPLLLTAPPAPPPRGRPAPAFTLPDLHGKIVRLADYKGKVVLVDFWATRCGSCVEAMPKFQELNDRLAGRGFAVLGLAADERGPEAVAAAAERKKIRYPILLANEATWTSYEVDAIPCLFLIDRQGRIVQRWGRPDFVGMEREVRRLLGE